MSNREPVKLARAAFILVSVAMIVAIITWGIFVYGESVDTKHLAASGAVTSDVMFGESSSSSSNSSSRSVPMKPSPPVLNRPAPQNPERTRSETTDFEIINTIRQTRQKKPSSGSEPAIYRGSSPAPSTPSAPPVPPAQRIPSPPPLEPGDLAPPVKASAKLAPGEVNPMTQVADDALSTFSIDVDTGSYTLARRTINEGYLIIPDRVRVEEFLNYFHYAYPEPQEGAFGVSLDAAPSPFKPALNRKIVRVGVQGRRLTPDSRKPVHLTFLVDVSGSMKGDHRIGLAKESLRILTWNLGAGDTVALSTYAGKVETVLEPTSMIRRNQVLEAINSLETSGATRMGDGLELAYKSAMDSFVPGDVNRVIVLSDGDANLGPISFSKMFKRIKKYVDEGITLTTIGFGMGNYRDEMMEQLANQGNGNYFYIDSKREAIKIFEEHLDATLQVIAKDVKIQVEFDPESVLSYRLIGYENRDIADHDFRNDSVDAGEIGAGHSVTALYEVVLTEAAAGGKATANFATVRIRAKTPTGTKAEEQAFALTSRDMHPTLADAHPDLQFAAAVAGFAEILRKSPYAQDTTLAHIEALARSASRLDQEDRQEFIGLVQQMRERAEDQESP